MNIYPVVVANAVDADIKHKTCGTDNTLFATISRETSNETYTDIDIMTYDAVFVGTERTVGMLSAAISEEAYKRAMQ